MTRLRASHFDLARLFGSSIVDQAMLSAANFAVGMLLIRYTPADQYGYYILAFNTMMLLTTLQGTFIGTPLVIRLPALDPDARRHWIGGLLRDQMRLGAAGAVIALATTAALWSAGVLDQTSTWVVLAALVLVLAALYREYLRGILLMLRRPHVVLAADALYVTGLLAGSLLAVISPAPAAIALLAGACSALVGARWLRKRMAADIDAAAPTGRLREIARVGIWAASGGVIYWLFNQGYNFLTAATLDLAAVAALAASRLTLMPINLLSAGMQKQLAPIASGWLHEFGARRTLRRLLGFSVAMGAMTLCYAAVLWLGRDWIFLDLMRKEFPQRDTMLILWSALFLLSVMREPVMLIPVLRQRFKTLTVGTLGCAVLALVISYFGMLAWGPMGAIVGILAGEFCYCVVVTVLALRESTAEPKPQATTDRKVVRP